MYISKQTFERQLIFFRLLISPMHITWLRPPVTRFSHDRITLKQKETEHKVVWLVWEFDCLHFAQYISMSPHGIGCKQTWCKKIYRMIRATWLKPLYMINFYWYHQWFGRSYLDVWITLVWLTNMSFVVTNSCNSFSFNIQSWDDNLNA